MLNYHVRRNSVLRYVGSLENDVRRIKVGNENMRGKMFEIFPQTDDTSKIKIIDKITNPK